MIEPERTDAGLPFAAQRYRPGRLGLVAIVGAAAALVMFAVLIGASLSRSALTPTGAPSNAATSSQAGSAVPSVDVTQANPTAALAAARQSVDAGSVAGDIDADTATRLQQNLQELSKRLEQGQEARVAEIVGELLKEIDEWGRSGRISPARAAELRALLQPLVVTRNQ